MMKKVVILLIILALAAITWQIIRDYRRNAIYRNPAFAHGNGRLEATEISVSTKLAGRIEQIYVNDGDFVTRGQLLALMQTDVLEAELSQAKARHRQTEAALEAAVATVKLRKSELAVAEAGLLQRQSSYEGARKRYDRAVLLLKDSALSRQDYEADETYFQNCSAEVTAAKAARDKSAAAIAGAEADVDGCRANVAAALADVERIEADLKDCRLTAPLDGRIQYRISQAGEVLPAGGTVLEMVDLSDVYMTFFLPEKEAGRAAIGTPVRLVLDAAPEMPIPAEVSFVSSTAQFTPKTVETAVERQKLMFRIKAGVSPELLKKHLHLIKTGLPGVAWVKFDPHEPWPEFLRLRSGK